jgi:geranylgeranyl pyrophosphate synthase
MDMPTSHIENEKIAEMVNQLLKEKGARALEVAKRTILEKNFASHKIKQAIVYFSEYWQDLARPALISICCEAVGGKSDLTTLVAASMTLICGAMDIHDDIIDQSKTKMSRPTILGKFGKDVALLIGDELFFEGFLLLNRSCENIERKKSRKVYEVISNMFFEIGNAEALELQLRNKMDITPDEYLSLLNMKAADVEACARIGAIIGDASEKEINALGKYGRTLGVIAILRDELADIAEYEELSNRIKNEPLPFPIILALQNPEVRPKMQSILSKKKNRKQDVERILEIIHCEGVDQWLVKLIEDMACKTKIFISGISNKQNLELLIHGVAFL